MRRMPLRTQRRNTPYLNGRIPRFGPLDRGINDQALMPSTGLAIDLDGSFEQRFRPDDFGVAYLGSCRPECAA
jgi:hypothetical protein